jgi:hypothetical protein
MRQVPGDAANGGARIRHSAPSRPKAALMRSPDQAKRQRPINDNEAIRARFIHAQVSDV